MSASEHESREPIDDLEHPNDVVGETPPTSTYVPQFKNYKVSETHRFTLLLSGSIGCFLASYSYTFGLFATPMTEYIGSDMGHIADVGTVMLVFCYFILPYAFIFDAFGPTPVLICGTVLLPLGSLLMAFLFDGTIHDPTTLKFCVFIAIMGGGSIIFDLGNIVSVMSWFPAFRGPIVAVMKSFAGLGSAVLGCWQLAFFEKSDQTGHLFYLMFAIALSGGLTTIFLMHLPPYHIPSYYLRRMSDEERDDRHSTKEVFMKKEVPRLRLYVALTYVVFLVFFLPIQTCLIVYADLSDAWKVAFAVVVIVALVTYPVFCLPLRIFDEEDEDPEVSPEDHHLTNNELEDEQQSVLEDLQFIAPQYQTTFVQGLCTIRLWCIFAACFAIVGSQLVVSYYYVFIAWALRGKQTDRNFTTLLNTMNGVGSAIGRLFLAWYEWWTQRKQPEERIPVTTCLFFPIVFTLVGLVLWIVMPGESLAVGHFVLALGNGSGAAAAVLVFRSIFAKEPATHYNFAFLASMVSAIVMNRVLFAVWYVHESYDYIMDICITILEVDADGKPTKFEPNGIPVSRCASTKPDVGIENIVYPYNTKVKICAKKRCVLMPMIVMICLNGVVLLAALYLHVEYTLYCKTVFATRAAAGLSEDDIDPVLMHKRDANHPAPQPKPEEEDEEKEVSPDMDE